jgi:hypothetical protein
MNASIVYWQRQNYSEKGFTLIEISEDAKLYKRVFKNFAGDYKDLCFEEKDCETKTLDGTIEIRKVDFGKDSKIKKADIYSSSEVIKTFDASQWQEARTHVRHLQNEVKENIHIDYFSDIVFDDKVLSNYINGEVKAQHTIVPLRVDNENSHFKREIDADQFAVIYVPVINEKIYFHHTLSTNHVSVTGDNLFDLDTKATHANLEEESLLEYIETIRSDIEDNPDHYRKLITQQRKRRAMVDTDVIGDLFPR